MSSFLQGFFLRFIFFCLYLILPIDSPISLHSHREIIWSIGLWCSVRPISRPLPVFRKIRGNFVLILSYLIFVLKDFKLSSTNPILSSPLAAESSPSALTEVSHYTSILNLSPIAEKLDSPVFVWFLSSTAGELASHLPPSWTFSRTPSCFGSRCWRLPPFRRIVRGMHLWSRLGYFHGCAYFWGWCESRS